MIVLFYPTAPEGVNNLLQPTLSNVHCLELRLSAHLNMFDHIPCLDNVCANLPSSWTAPPLLGPMISITLLYSSSFDTSDWPSANHNAISQRLHVSSRPNDFCISEEDIYSDGTGAIYVPGNDYFLQPRLGIMGHTGRCTHCVASLTASVAHMHFVWSTLLVDIDIFVRNFIGGLSAAGDGSVASSRSL